jgi:hypothetical protein
VSSPSGIPLRSFRVKLWGTASNFISSESIPGFAADDTSKSRNVVARPHVLKRDRFTGAKISQTPMPPGAEIRNRLSYNNIT